MNKNDIWLPLLASIGVGAATFYTMSKSDKPLDKAIENIAPLLNNMTNSTDNSKTEQMGPHGMS